MDEIEIIKRTLSLYGYVYEDVLFLCHKKLNNHKFAIKKEDKNEMSEYEYNIMLQLNHPSIVKLYDIFEDENSRYLVMEYCSKGTILQKGKIPKDQLIFYFKQLLEALAYCHSLNITHRDIKPINIYLDQYDHVKLADFGLAKKFNTNEKTNEKNGTLMFFAPEMIQYPTICPFKADIWALGITFYFMATGNFPFQSKSREQLKRLILLGELNLEEYDIDPNFQNLIKKMTAINVNLRPMADELLKLPIFTLNCNKLVTKNVFIKERHSAIRRSSINRFRSNLLMI